AGTKENWFMKTSWLILAVLVGLGLGVTPLLRAVSEKAPADRIGRLITDLGSNKFTERAKAAKALEAIGEPALPALRKAVKTGDAETSRRAEALIAKIEQKAEQAALLAPTRVHLVCKNMPVADAVALLAKKSKYTIQIDGISKAKLAKRKVTLDTGDVTFWEALDKLCAKAGLVELTSANNVIGMPADGRLPGGIQILPAPDAKPLPIRKPPVKKGKPVQQGKQGGALAKQQGDGV